MELSENVPAAPMGTKKKSLLMAFLKVFKSIWSPGANVESDRS